MTKNRLFLNFPTFSIFLIFLTKNRILWVFLTFYGAIGPARKFLGLNGSKQFEKRIALIKPHRLKNLPKIINNKITKNLYDSVEITDIIFIVLTKWYKNAIRWDLEDYLYVFKWHQSMARIIILRLKASLKMTCIYWDSNSVLMIFLWDDVILNVRLYFFLISSTNSSLSNRRHLKKFSSIINDTLTCQLNKSCIQQYSNDVVFWNLPSIIIWWTKFGNI